MSILLGHSPKIRHYGEMIENTLVSIALKIDNAQSAMSMLRHSKSLAWGKGRVYVLLWIIIV